MLIFLDFQKHIIRQKTRYLTLSKSINNNYPYRTVRYRSINIMGCNLIQSVPYGILFLNLADDLLLDTLFSMTSIVNVLILGVGSNLIWKYSIPNRVWPDSIKSNPKKIDLKLWFQLCKHKFCSRQQAK